MNLLTMLFGDPVINALDAHRKAEVRTMIEKLVTIGRKDDFLSLVPGGDFDMQCHHREAREIGKRLNEMGGLPLMWSVRNSIRGKLKDTLAEHLDHCWKEIGKWEA
ncbi:MAG TPA: hypothetical protein VLR89_09835 [Anaerolineaceae bacterium]|nr:hypothetical protein [Anaerolineaceae bacterium]